MGSYCSSINGHLIYLPEVEEEKKHGKTRTTLNKQGNIRVYNKRNKSNSLSEKSENKNISAFKRDLRRRYSDNYGKLYLVNNSFMKK